LSPRLAPAVLGLFLGACNLVLGLNDDPYVRSGDAGLRCVLNSDCPEATKVCIYGACSPRCAADRDCDRGERCLRTENGVGCVRADSTSCGSDEDCPPGALCFGASCRNACDMDGDCLGGQVCREGACTGTDAAHDPAPEEPSICVEQEIRCDGQATAARSRCTGGTWESEDPCPNGQNCDTASEPPGQCASIVAECVGRAPGAELCVGAERIVCGVDLTTAERTLCASSQYCAYGSGNECAVCLPEEHECAGTELRICNDDQTGFVAKETCASADAPCNEDARACTALACFTDQKRCSGDSLEQCNADQSGWTQVELCGPGLCDPVALQCEFCAAGQTTCRGDDVASCSADGKSETLTPCPLDAPRCVGTGACVCLSAGDCTPLDECHEAYCAAGGCGDQPKSEGEPCTAGVCNGSGACVECTPEKDSLCVAPTTLCRNNTCVDPVHLQGWPDATGSSSIIADWLYWLRLPALEYNARLAAFGVVGTGTGASVRLALYKDDGTGTQASAFIASTSASIATDDGPVETTAFTPSSIVLGAGTTHWIAFKSNVDTSLKAAADASAVGFRAQNAFGDAFIDPLPPETFLTANQTGYGVYIRIEDME
jgi:hypothetical protein